MACCATEEENMFLNSEIIFHNHFDKSERENNQLQLELRGPLQVI
jgi:hypothetical protein